MVRRLMNDDIEERRTPLGRYLKDLREARGISQGRLARATLGAVTDGYIGQIEAGGRNPSLSKLIVIAEALELDDLERAHLVGLLKQPDTATPSVPTSDRDVESAIAADGTLSPDAKKALLASYRAMRTTSRPTGVEPEPEGP